MPPQNTQPAAAPVAPTQATAPVVAAPAPAMVMPSAPASSNSTGWGAIAGIVIVVLLLAAGGAYFFFLQEQQRQQAALEQATVMAQEEAMKQNAPAPVSPTNEAGIEAELNAAASDSSDSDLDSLQGTL